jgi:hypothetical protein
MAKYATYFRVSTENQGKSWPRPRSGAAITPWHMNMKAVFTGRQASKLRGDHQPLGAIRKGHRTQRRSDACGVDRVDRGYRCRCVGSPHVPNQKKLFSSTLSEKILQEKL